MPKTKIRSGHAANAVRAASSMPSTSVGIDRPSASAHLSAAARRIANVVACGIRMPSASFDSVCQPSTECASAMYTT
mgnify:CR=1 FL=1